MKKILFLLLFAYQCLNAQTYVPFPTENAVWRGQYSEGPAPGFVLYWDYQLYIVGDTVIQNTSYHNWYLKEVFSQWSTQPGFSWALQPTIRPFGGFREDNKKIYLWDYQDSTEYLLYDFDSLSVGDSINHWYKGLSGMNRYLGVRSPSPFIDNIDSVLVANTYRKRYHIQTSVTFCGIPYDAYIIEGIGYTCPMTMCEFEQMSRLLCFSLNDSVIWVPQWAIANCELPPSTIGIEDVAHSSVFISPNPFIDKVNLIFPDEIKMVNLLIFNLQGQLVYEKKIMHQKEIQLELTKLPLGMYHLLIGDTQGHIIRRKLIKE